MAILSDFRYPGGTTASIAEEVRAQAQNGLSTTLVQVESPHLRCPAGFSPRIVDCLRAGWAELALPGEPVRCRLLVIRQPRIFTVDPTPAPRIEAEQIVMVVNQGPLNLGGERYYDLGEVGARVHRLFGAGVLWAPIGPLVRNQVLGCDSAFPLTGDDWHNVIDVDQWLVERNAPVTSVPVIGRHSRPDPEKWPRTPQAILGAYPSGDAFKIRVLGGAGPAEQRLGRLPANWEVYPFGSRGPREFLAEIDYFVYFHDPNWVEAFGRSIMEAMASGAPAILPEHFRPLFGDAGIYTTPDGVADVVRHIHRDWSRYRHLSDGAARAVRERFGYATHLARLARLGAVPNAAPEPDATATATAPQAEAQAAVRTDRAPAPSGPVRRRRRDECVLLLSSNGAGLGHVTRLMAIARRLPDTIRVVIATQSQAVPLIRGEGYLTEYIPSSRYLGIAPKPWNRLLRQRLNHLVELYRPRLVAADGVVPYEGLRNSMRDHRDITWAWVRRAMWRPGLGADWIERGKAFDAVLEPGELAEHEDRGLTVPQRDTVERVDPITYLDRTELLPRDQARIALGLDDRPAALIQLGAGNINDTRSTTARAARVLADLGFQVVVARSPIATTDSEPPQGIRTVTVYPISPYLSAFDLCVTASGYNSFHESLAFALPTVFVPNTATELDDQVARARFAHAAGTALRYEEDSGEAALEETLILAAKPEQREELAHRCRQLARPNGAGAAAAWITRLLDGK